MTIKPNAYTDALFSNLEIIRRRNNDAVKSAVDAIYDTLRPQFKHDDKLGLAMTVLRSFDSKAVKYELNDRGDIVAWLRAEGLTVPDPYRRFLDRFLAESNMAFDYENNALCYNLGSNNYIIQDNYYSPHSNGVWLSGTLIIPADRYESLRGIVNVAERDRLIKKHMVETGGYPGVYRLATDDQLYPVPLSL